MKDITPYKTNNFFNVFYQLQNLLKRIFFTAFIAFWSKLIKIMIMNNNTKILNATINIIIVFMLQI